MRVDSPGGSAFASELIREELLALQATGKPVVASFAAVAASGGYWISASADAIYAEPTTITGSIGIFGIVPNFSESLGALGIYTDGVSSAPLARGMSVVGSLSDQAKNILQLSVEHGYAEFIDLVANGRGMPQTEVEKIAQGRVWSGLAAKNLGLVDELGGLQKPQITQQNLPVGELEHRGHSDALRPSEPNLMELMQATGTSRRSGLDRWTQTFPWLGPFRAVWTSSRRLMTPDTSMPMPELRCTLALAGLTGGGFLPIVLSHLLNLFAHQKHANQVRQGHQRNGYR